MTIARAKDAWPDGDSFINYHLAISRASYTKLRQEGLYDYAGSEPLEVVKIKNPGYERYEQLLEKVGGPWGWPQRPRYHDNREELEAMLQKPDTSLFILRKGNAELGYALVNAGKADFENLLRGMPPAERKSGAIIEIENFGLFPEHTGKGYGHFFLAEIFEDLFQDYQTVYLSSRSTNHSGVIPFYKSMGMNILFTETLKDDLITKKTLPLRPVPKIQPLQGPQY